MSYAQRKLPAKRAFVGLQGSSFSKLHVVPPQAPQPAQEKSVKVHHCFDQRPGETKPDRCKCTVHFTKEEAYEAVDAGRASFLLVKNPKTPKLTKNHSAIVIKQATVAGQTLFAIAGPVKVDRRDARHAAIKTGIIVGARRLLQKLFAEGVISQQDVKISDAELENMLKNPERFLARIDSRKLLRDKFAGVVTHYWNNILGYHRLNVGAGQFMAEADRGTGLATTGGYDSAKTDLVQGARDSDTGRVVAANFRPQNWNGGWVYSVGQGPKVDEDDDEKAARMENEHSVSVAEDEDED